jgi:hypothetical protein
MKFHIETHVQTKMPTRNLRETIGPPKYISTTYYVYCDYREGRVWLMASTEDAKLAYAILDEYRKDLGDMTVEEYLQLQEENS